MNNLDTIHIVLAADRNYMKHLCVTAMSIIENTNAIIHFHILSDNYPIELKKMCSTINKKIIVSFYNTDKIDFSSFPLTINYISKATYYRLLLPNLLPNDISKVLYLDVDIIVRQDVQKFYELDIENYYAAAVTDELDVYQCKRLQLSKYFNAGVILFNIKKLRKDNCLQQFFEIAKRDDIRFQDQDILNIAFKDNWLNAELSWNAGSVLFHPDIFCDTSESVASVRKAVHNPFIVHFTGKYKPWQFTCCHPYKKEYLKYLMKTSLVYYKLIQILLFLFSFIINVNMTFKELTIQIFLHNILSIYGNNNKVIKICGITLFKIKRGTRNDNIK